MNPYAHTRDALHGVDQQPLLRIARILVTVAVYLVVALGGSSLTTGPEAAFARKDKTRATATTMREKVYAKISKAAALVESGDYAAARKELDGAKKIRRLNGYEKAQLFMAYGFLYYSMDDFPKAIEAYQTVLVQENLPDGLRLSTMYTVAQLQFQLEDYQQAIASLQAWLKVSENPGPGAYLLIAQAYYQLEKYEEAVSPVLRAMEIAKARNQPVQEKWYLLLRVFYYELQDYPKVLDVLEHLIAEYPRREYWVQIASMYSELGDDEKQLAAYELAYMQGLMSRGSEVVLLSQLLLQAEVPYRAGIILARGLADDVVEKTPANYRLLSQAWTLAQEDDKAIAALIIAAGMTDDGELDTWLAYAYSNAGQWHEAVGAAEEALRKGVDEPDELQLLIGQALYQLDRFDAAKAAFSVAQKSPDSADDAAKWIKHIEAEQMRLEGLESSLKK